MGLDKCRVHALVFVQVAQQAVEQTHIGSRSQRQMQIGQIAAVGITGVDHNDFKGRIVFLCLANALKSHRVAPSRVGADQHQQIGRFQVFIIARNGIRAESAFISDHGGRHA